MEIIKATYDDLPRLMEIFSSARAIMRNSGNPHQWNDKYPSEDIILKDIAEGVCHLLHDSCCGTIATMAFIPGPDPTYAHIYKDISMNEEIRWPDEKPYHVIHRIAADGPGHGAFDKLINWACDKADTIRIDTHPDNAIMQYLLDKHEFTRCGIIRLESGAARIAYIRHNIIP